MSVTINGDGATPQPSILLEELLQIQSENTAIGGAQQRNRIGQKKQATLTFSNLNTTDYQNLIAKFTSGSGIGYLNNLSDYSGGVFTFSGIPFFNESPYVAGSSLYRDFKVRIREQ